MIREQIKQEALTWVGTPYHHMGKIKGVGVDCAQILIKIYSSVGLISDFDTGYYPMDWALHRNEELYLQGLENYAIPTDNLQIGDIVAYKFGRCVSHAGIYIGGDLIVHSWLHNKEVSISRIDEGELSGRIAGYFTIVKD